MNLTKPINRRKSSLAAEPAIPKGQHGEIPLGMLLAAAGKLTDLDINRVVVAQRQMQLRFGEAAVRLGLVNKADVAEALAQQFRYPYVTRESPLAPSLVAAHRPFSSAAEAVRGLRSQLLLRWANDPCKLLAVVAPRSRSGCSHLAANLAIAFAQLGERTLLIDANLRRPSQHVLFGIPPGNGLSSLLAGRCEIEAVLKPVMPFTQLRVICAGTQPPNPQELLSRSASRYLLETAPARFDVVIIDTPPILEYADAQIIAAAAGGCLLTARRHRTRLNDIALARAKLAPARAALLGMALIG